jgi:hypothetical protein
MKNCSLKWFFKCGGLELDDNGFANIGCYYAICLIRTLELLFVVGFFDMFN